jgi:hypothetical protein
VTETRIEGVGPVAPPAPDTTGVEIFAVEVAELALILAGLDDDECVATLKAVNEDLAGTDLAVDFFVAVLKRKSALEQTTMTSLPQ